MYCGTTFMSC